jgi:hypothetical protein
MPTRSATRRMELCGIRSGRAKSCWSTRLAERVLRHTEAD